MDQLVSYLNAYLNRPKAMSLRQLAFETGISHAHLSRIRDGQCVPTLKVAENLALAMGTTLSRILQKRATCA